jgi:predicted RNase H-like HicB family nuclease
LSFASFVPKIIPLDAANCSFLQIFYAGLKNGLALQNIASYISEEAQKLYEKYKAQQLRRQLRQHTFFLALFEPMNSRGFRAVCPAVENCTVEAPTREEAKAALIKALEQRLRAKIEAGESVPIERGSAEMIEVRLGEK